MSDHKSQDHGAHDHGHGTQHGGHEDHSHDWFRHAPGELVQEDHGSFNATMVFAVIFVTMFVVAAVIIVLWPHTKRSIEQLSVERQERNEAAFVEFRNARAAWEGALHGDPVWINRAEGTLQIPFDLAAEQVIRRYADR